MYKFKKVSYDPVSDVNVLNWFKFFAIAHFGAHYFRDTLKTKYLFMFFFLLQYDKVYKITKDAKFGM